MQILIQILGLLILLAVSPGKSQEAPASVADELRNRFLQSDFREITNQSELPQLLVASFRGFGPSDIADAGEPYNYSDYMDGNQPSRQIVLAGVSDGVMFLVLNQGGIAPHQYTIVVAEESGVVRKCSYFFAPPQAVELDDLRIKFKSREYAAESRCEDAV